MAKDKEYIQGLEEYIRLGEPQKQLDTRPRPRWGTRSSSGNGDG